MSYDILRFCQFPSDVTKVMAKQFALILIKVALRNLPVSMETSSEL